jgi:hypothetical protein
MTPKKPASRPIAKALPHPSGRGLAAQYALPGLVPAFVAGSDGKPARYESEDAARVAALDAAFAVLEERSRQSRTANGYEIITAENLAGLLNDAGLTADEFAEIGGWSVARVNMWMSGEADIPHVAHLVAVLMSVEENYQDARSLANARVKVKEGNRSHD